VFSALNAPTPYAEMPAQPFYSSCLNSNSLLQQIPQQGYAASSPLGMMGGVSYGMPASNYGYGGLSPLESPAPVSSMRIPMPSGPAPGAFPFGSNGALPAGATGAVQGASSSSKTSSKSVTLSKVQAGEQDSDLMERMGDGVFTGCGAAGSVPLVSLGCSCGPKLSFKDIGRGSETLPFDWSRTRVEGILQFLATDFAGFFDTAVHNIKYRDEQGTEWNAFRSPIHSFWHDDPYHPAMRERYTRRINRLLSMKAFSSPVLFVRSVAQTSEISRSAELLSLLQQKFGPYAMLLVIVDFQGPTAAGPCLIPGMNNLLIWFFDTESAPSRAAPYGKCIATALSWAIGEPINARRLPNLSAAQSMVKPTTWGMYGAAKVPAFYPGVC
jgi:hypothetical protein